MATETISACTGSSLLQPISEITNLPLDQVNFVVCQLCALLTAVWFRLYLHPSKTSPFVRHVVATLLGIYFALFCFGWYALHFLLQSGITYGIMILTGVEHMHKYKDRFFSNNTAPEAKLHLKQELQMMSRAEAEGSRAEAAEPPAKLFLKAQASTSSSLDTVFEEITKEQPQAAQPLAAGAAIELDTYLGEAPSPREDSPLKY